MYSKAMQGLSINSSGVPEGILDVGGIVVIPITLADP